MRDRAGPVRDRPCSFFVGGAGPCGGAAACRRPAVHFRSRIPVYSACVSPRAVFGRGRIRRMPQVCRCSAKALFPRYYRLRRIRALSIALDRGGLKSPVTVPAAVRCRRRWLHCTVRVRGMAVRPVIGRCAAGIKQRSRPERAASSFYVMRFEPLSGYNGFWSSAVM